MKPAFDRRDVLRSLGASAGLALLSGCGTIPVPTQRPFVGDIVDTHAHIFNATDLPARQFIKTVFLSHYPEQGFIQTLDLRAASVLDAILDLFVWIFTGGAPTARDEIRVLTGAEAPQFEFSSRRGTEQLVTRRVASFLMEPARLEATAAGADAVRRAIVAAGSRESIQSFTQLSSTQAREIASNAYRSEFDIGVYLRWFGLFTRYRYSLADELAQDHARLGYGSAIIAPAMVDFIKWFDIDSELERSSLRDQMEVMGLIARRRTGPSIHGYVAFDPLREALYRRGRVAESPLALAREAIQRHGFAGIKLYPPMGFKPWNNGDQPYPKKVTDLFGGRPRVSAALDAALADLYDLAVELDAPVLAHAADSNDAGLHYARRGDPHYWIPVWENWPALRVCLAHFGSFDAVSAGRPAGSNLPEASWEFTLGRFLRDHPGAGIFADLSFYAEILNAGAAQRTALAEAFQTYATRFDPEVRHIVFGSDWLMLANQRDHLFYAERLVAFLEKECRLSAAQIERILVSNPLAFLGLQSDGARQRRLSRTG